MATRQKKKLIQEVTREAAEDAFAKYNQCHSKLEIIQGKMNAEISKIKEKYDDNIAALQDEKDENFEMIQAYAEAHPELFEKRKSAEWTHGTFGFRTGTHKLKTLKGFTWDKVKELVKHMLPDYIRSKEEVNKDLILLDREKPILKEKMKSLGLEVVQDETFFVQPNLEDVVTA